MEVLQTYPLANWVRRPENFVPYLRVPRVSTRGGGRPQRGVPVGGVDGVPAAGSDSFLRFSSFFCRFSSAFMRRSASRRSRTLLLKARPPSMAITSALQHCSTRTFATLTLAPVRRQGIAR